MKSVDIVVIPPATTSLSIVSLNETRPTSSPNCRFMESAFFTEPFKASDALFRLFASRENHNQLLIFAKKFFASHHPVVNILFKILVDDRVIDKICFKSVEDEYFISRKLPDNVDRIVESSRHDDVGTVFSHRTFN